MSSGKKKENTKFCLDSLKIYWYVWIFDPSKVTKVLMVLTASQPERFKKHNEVHWVWS